MWEISRLLLHGTDTVDKVGKEKYFMEVAHTPLAGNIDDLPSPRILNNHLPFGHQPADLLRKNTKVIFVYRNPKDVAVSFYYHLKNLHMTGEDIDFRSFLQMFVDGLLPSGFYCDYLREWERGIKASKDLDILLLSYEDIQKNSLREVEKLSKFLEKSYDEEFLKRVVTATHIDNMRTAKANPEKPKMSKLYRKGKVGDWKNHFTVADSEWFDRIIRNRMADSDMFTFEYEL